MYVYISILWVFHLLVIGNYVALKSCTSVHLGSDIFDTNHAVSSVLSGKEHWAIACCEPTFLRAAKSSKCPFSKRWCCCSSMSTTPGPSPTSRRSVTLRWVWPGMALSNIEVNVTRDDAHLWWMWPGMALTKGECDQGWRSPKVSVAKDDAHQHFLKTSRMA